MASGWSNAEMAEHLHLSLDTIKTHLRRTFRMTGARDRAHLVTWAYLSGAVPLPVCNRVHVPTVAEAAERDGVPLTHADADQVPPRW